MGSKKDKKKKRSTAERAKNRAETHKTGFENTAFELPEDNKRFELKSDKAVRLDIIPYEVGKGNPYADEGELHYERTYFVHRSIGVDQTSYVCLSKTCGEACPICEFRAKLMKDPDADEDMIKDLAPKERQLFNVINTKEKSKGVQVWDMSFHLFGKKLDYEIKNSDEDDGYESFAELEGGFTLKCGIEESSFSGRSFFEVVSINFKPRFDDYDNDILGETACLDDILIIKEYNELKEIFLQTADIDDDDKKDKKDKKSGSKKKENDDDDNDDDTEEDDDDNDDDSNKDPKWEKGDRVMVEDEDGDDVCGKITKVDKDEQTAKIKLDNGEIMKGVDFDDIKPEPEKKDKKDKKDKKNKKNKCPGGGKFGKDTDELPECNDCELWDACDDA